MASALAITASTLETRPVAMQAAAVVVVDAVWPNRPIDSMEITAVTVAVTLALPKMTGGATNVGRQDERWTNQVCLERKPRLACHRHLWNFPVR